MANTKSLWLYASERLGAGLPAEGFVVVRVRWVSRVVSVALLLGSVLFLSQATAATSTQAGISEHVYAAGGGRLYAFVNDARFASGATTGIPWVLYVHGGSWAYGAPNEASAVGFCRHQAERGVSCFSADYPLTPSKIWPAQLDMVQAQLAWVRAHSKDLHLNSHEGFVIGHSAGGLMAGVAGLDDGHMAGVAIFDGATNLPQLMTSALHHSLRVHAADLVGGRSADSALARSATVLAHVRHDTARVPFLVIQDAHDPVVSARTSTDLAAGLSRDGFAVSYDLLPFATHSTESNPRALAMADAWIRGRLAVISRRG